MDHKAGEKLYVDFAGDKLEIINEQTGELKPVEVFVAILGASQLTYVEAVMTQQKKRILFLPARMHCITVVECSQLLFLII
jgi:transposase